MPSRTRIGEPDDYDVADVDAPARGSARATVTAATAGPATRANGSVRRRLIKDDVEYAAPAAVPFTMNPGVAPLPRDHDPHYSGVLDFGPPPPRRSTNRRSATNGSAAGSSRAPRGSMLPPVTKNPPRDLAYEVVGVLCVAVGGWLLYNASGFRAEGVVSEVVVGGLRWMLGIGAVIMPALLGLLGLMLIVRRHHTNLRAFTRGVAVGTLVLLTAAHLAVPPHQEFANHEVLFTHGGYVGAGITWLLRRSVGEVGAIIALVAFSIVALLFFTEVSLSQLARGLGNVVRGGTRRVVRGVEAHNALHASLAQEYEPEAPEFFDEEPRRPAPRRKLRALPEEIILDSQGLGPAHRNGLAHDETADGPDATNGRHPRSPFLALDDVLQHDVAAVQANAKPFKKTSSNPQSAIRDLQLKDPQAEGPRIEIIDTPPPPSVVDGPDDSPDANAAPSPPTAVDEMTPIEALEAQALATAGTGAPVRRQRPQGFRRRFGDGPLMPEYFDNGVRALDPPIAPDVMGVEDDIQQGVQSVQETLASFKIDARVTDVKRGPVITRYEVQPAPGVRVAAIANLDRDLARSLSAIAVRIEAPVPGKNVVGIEVPNKRVHLVRVRDVLELPEFLAAPSKLSFVLGKDIAGQAKWADLTKMPHLLIAGATNSGKSVCLNSIITSILVRATPEEVKFSLIDPKRVELTLYKDIKHLYHPVVVEPKDAVKALRGAIAEMDRRYKRFAERGVRNIASYNGKLEEGEAPLPYIVIVIDELADLMMTAAAEFEKLICRLAQLARATGIHLIVATQRPSVNVITGVIKANIPARIAFAVASQVDSRTILDCVGAERLIGSGDMLYDNNTGGKPTRIQGAYLSEEEVNRIVDVVKHHYSQDEEPLDYGLDLTAIEDPMGGDDDNDGIVEEKRDDLYDVIKEFVLRNAEMSASMIQRKFEIGYPRAGRIVDQLEREGILSPADGSKARKVIGMGRS